MSAQSDIWQVTRIVDGDTYYASREGETAKFRLIGIDTHEFSHFGRTVEPYAQEVTNPCSTITPHFKLRFDEPPYTRPVRTVV